jgi:glycosyltransferase involved in cell wall biosynthesis
VFCHGYLQPDLSAGQREQAREVLLREGISGTSKVRFSFFGTLGRSCGLQYLIEAVRHLSDEEQRLLEVVVCGTGPRLAEFQQQAAGIEAFKFIGWRTSAELIALMEMTDVGLALYSEKSPQSLPNKPIEYLAGGLPVLSTLSGELQNLLSAYDCGVTVPAGNCPAMIKALRELLYGDALRERLSANSKILYEDRFSAKEVYSEMIEYLEDIASDAGRNIKTAKSEVVAA